ncbi:MAG: hypothetical protein ACRD0N_07965 [Acidimicrobiales bacterium]
MYEYTSEVFAVGLEGFAQVDNKRITAMAAQGWEPTHMTTVHNGFAAVVLFRREGTARRAPAKAAGTRVRKAAATKAAPARKAPAAKKSARRTRG